jgi:hypothetical protein
MEKSVLVVVAAKIGVFAFADLVSKRDQMKEERVNLSCKFLTSSEIRRLEAVLFLGLRD